MFQKHLGICILARTKCLCVFLAFVTQYITPMLLDLQRVLGRECVASSQVVVIQKYLLLEYIILFIKRVTERNIAVFIAVDIAN